MLLWPSFKIAMAAIQCFKCNNCNFAFSNFIGNPDERMVKNWNGYSTILCGNCLKNVKVNLDSEQKTCPVCSGHKLVGINDFECPRCGGDIEEDTENVVMI